MTSTAKGQVHYASILGKRTKQKRRGRPEGAEISKRLVLRAFLQKSETLLSALRQKWGLERWVSVPSELRTNPDFRKDELALRNPSLTTDQIVGMTKLSRRNIVPLLHKLAKDGSLRSRINHKTKVYEPCSLEEFLEECRKPLIIDGSRSHKKRQVERLRNLGLDVLWVRRGPGRPKTLNRDEDVKLGKEIMTLVQKGNLQAVENISDSTKMGFKQHDGIVTFFYTTKDGQMDRIQKAISQHKKDQKRRRREEKSRLGSRPVAPADKNRIMRNARLR
jgi:hypothetical protein